MKKKIVLSSVMASIVMLLLSVFIIMPVFAAETETAQDATTEAVLVETETEAGESDVLSSKAIAAALVVGIASAAGAIGMAIAIAKSTEGMARQPEASSKINSAMMLGLVFIETAIIYALIIAILIIFVL